MKIRPVYPSGHSALKLVLLLAFLTALLPTAALPDTVSTSSGSITTTENGSLLFSLSSLVTSTDPIASYTIVFGPFNGSLVPDGPVGTFDYAPNQYFVGSDSFTFIATDTLGDVSNPSIVSIGVTEVNLPPQVSNGFLTTAPSTPLEIVLSTLASPTNGVPIVSYGIGTPNDGTISGFDPSDGIFFYVPNAGFTGTDIFPFSAEAANGLDAIGNIVVGVQPQSVAPTPEPSTLTFFAFGLLGVFVYSLKKASA
jgi:hypothetical protein